MSTKDRILEAARDLFNTTGIDNVSTRTICDRLKISPGNFTYYYTNKNQIVADLYASMREECKVTFAAIAGSNPGILTYLEMHQKLFQIQDNYKFLYLNLFEIVTNNPEIKEAYLLESKLEHKAAIEMLRYYAEKNVLKKGISDEEYEKFVNVGQILNNAWLVDAEVFYKGNQKKKMSYYMGICCGLLEPYLTEKAAKEYRDFFKNL
jgi:AcrR family transcriptional regulator